MLSDGKTFLRGDKGLFRVGDGPASTKKIDLVVRAHQSFEMKNPGGPARLPPDTGACPRSFLTKILSQAPLEPRSQLYGKWWLSTLNLAACACQRLLNQSWCSSNGCPRSSNGSERPFPKWWIPVQFWTGVPTCVLKGAMGQNLTPHLIPF